MTIAQQIEILRRLEQQKRNRLIEQAAEEFAKCKTLKI